MIVNVATGFSRRQGFTLIELMIVVAIAGLLVAVALPSYQAHIVRSKRAEAMAALQGASSALEKYRANRGFSYANASLIGGGGVELYANQVPVEGGDAYYTLELDIAVDGASYTLTAEPVSGSTQDGDGNLTLDNAGRKTWGAKNCWPSSGNDC